MSRWIRRPCHGGPCHDRPLPARGVTRTGVSVLWRRLDTPGHDACLLEAIQTGWRLVGTAVFRGEEPPAQLAYEVRYDSSWRVREGQVRGWLGDRKVALHISRSNGSTWHLNDAAVSGLEDIPDLDFGFTPATNLPQLRRLALAPGQAAEAPAVWLDVAAATLEVLEQRYERRSDTAYWYEAPRFRYAALLEVTPAGFVRRYPGLWELED